jgi:hypothetical protein
LPPTSLAQPASENSLPVFKVPISEKEIAAAREIIPPMTHADNQPIPLWFVALAIEIFLKKIPIPTTVPKSIASAEMNPIFRTFLIVISISF